MKARDMLSFRAKDLETVFPKEDFSKKKKKSCLFFKDALS